MTRRSGRDAAKMTYRGLWIIFGSLAVMFAAFAWAPKRAVLAMMVAAFAGAGLGGIIYYRDMYRDLQRYVRERDEFERQLRER